MSIPEAIYTPLKEKLTDVKVTIDGKETSLLELIAGNEGWYEKSIHAKKIQENNADLTKQRSELEKTVKEHKNKVADLENDVAKAKEDQLTPEEKKEFINIKKKGMTDEYTARFNALEAQNKELSESVGNLSSDLENEKVRTAEAKFNEALKAQQNRVLTTLSENKIEGAKADAALALMASKGYIGITKNDDGTLNEKYRIFKDNKELESTLAKTVECFAKDNEFLVSGTSQGGTGNEHKSVISQGNDLTPMQLLNSENKGYD